MADPAITKVEDKLVQVLTAWPALAGLTVTADAKPDEEVEPETIIVYTTSYAMMQSDEQGQSRHAARIEFESVSQPTSVGTISRRNQAVLAHIIAAIAKDRTLGGMVEDIQEIDVAPVEANGRDRGAASLQTEVTFYTPRDDWFTIVGFGGVHF